MTTATMKAAVADTFQTLKQLKDRYCPNGQTCDDIASLSLFAFVIWFMYIAMEPLM